MIDARIATLPKGVRVNTAICPPHRSKRQPYCFGVKRTARGAVGSAWIDKG